MPAERLPGPAGVADGDEATPPYSAEHTVSLLAKVARRHPDVDAFVEAGGERITYGGWDRAASGVAAALAARGVRAGDVVCLVLPSSIRYMICFQAAMRLGAITSGVNARLGPDELLHIFGSSAPRLTIVDAAPAGGLPPAAGTIVRWSELEPSVNAPGPELPKLRSSDPVVICWTGGSTGRPKGAVFDHDNLAAMAASGGVLSAPFDRRLSPLPFAHVGTMTRCWDEICRVVTTVITPTPWQAGATLELMERERVTVAQGVPTQWELMLRHERFHVTDLSSLRLAASGGSRVPPDLLARMRRQLGVPVLNRYASTESVVISGSLPDDPDEVVTETVGRAAPGVQIRVIGEDGAVLGPCQPGRIQVRSAAVMRGYWRDPDATAAVISPDGWLTVGDIGSLDRDGYLRFLGRSGEMFVRGGYNIYPVEVERVLAEHDAVAQAAVVPAPDPVLGEIGVAFVVASGDISSDELRAFVAGRLADFKAPDRVVFVEELPLTSVAKIDRRRLQERAAGEHEQKVGDRVPIGADCDRSTR